MKRGQSSGEVTVTQTRLLVVVVTVGRFADGWDVRSEEQRSRRCLRVWPERLDGRAAIDRDACLMLYQFSISALTNRRKHSGLSTSTSYLPVLEARSLIQVSLG